MGAQGWVWGSTELDMGEHRAGYGRALSGNEWKGPLAGILTTSWDIAFLAMGAKWSVWDGPMVSFPRSEPNQLPGFGEVTYLSLHLSVRQIN